MKPKQGKRDRDDEYANIPRTDPEYGLWMKAHPKYMLAMLKVAQLEFDKKYPKATRKKQVEMKNAFDAFRDETGSAYVDATYNGIVRRVNRIDPTFVLNAEDLKEIESCDAALDELLDVALGIYEPERTRILKHMMHTRDYVRKILAAQ